MTLNTSMIGARLKSPAMVEPVRSPLLLFLIMVMEMGVSKMMMGSNWVLTAHWGSEGERPCAINHNSILVGSTLS